jgi:hypothetical protein
MPLAADQSSQTMLSRGIAARHHELPRFASKDAEIGAIVTYMYSLPTTTKR